MTNGIYTILLLILSNVFMTFAWYGHLRLQQSGISSNWPLYLVIAFFSSTAVRFPPTASDLSTMAVRLTLYS